jgi:hypothetical protein
MFMRFRGGGIGHKGILERIAGLRNKEPLLTAEQINEDPDSEIVEGLGNNDDEEDEEDEDSDSDSGEDSDKSLDEFILDGEEGGEDEYDVLGFAAF